LPFPRDFSSDPRSAAQSSSFVGLLGVQTNLGRVESERKSELIGRGPLRITHVLAVGLLTASFVCAGFATHPASARASTNDAGLTVGSSHAIAFESNGTITQHVTGAATVGDFLRERNVTIGPHDFVDPPAGAPLSDGLVVVYRAAVAVSIQDGRQTIAATSSAQNVGTLLDEQQVRLAPGDAVQPPLSDPLPSSGIVRIDRVVSWMRDEKHVLASKTVHQFDYAIAPGTTKTMAPGSPGERDVIVRYTRRDDGSVQRWVVASHVTRKPRPRIVAVGAGEYQGFARFEAQGVSRMAYIAQSALQMVATAYTASCAGCDGITAIGRPAGHGIVAVDPRVIPLGTRLFISGYGAAVAGDTGGAIRGLRIDLGFNSLREAMLFGRREVTVYRLK
jgi:3D (Asp-Asp-Asp) domain-containing protein